jgi:hypothetical protein
MKGLARLVALAFLGALVTPTPSWARKVEDWPYSRLLERADLVVVGAAPRSAPCAAEWPERLFDAARFAGVETRFEVRAVLKGEAPRDLRVIHFAYRRGAEPYEDGSGLLSFVTRARGPHPGGDGGAATDRAGGERRALKVTERPAEYLLFLARRADGAYQAISGQLDPSSSVRSLTTAAASK